MTDEHKDAKDKDETPVTEGATPATEADATAEGAADAPAEVAPPAPPPVPRLTVAFPLAVVALQLALAWYFVQTSTTPTRTYMGIGAAPIVATLLMLAWWMLSRTIPLRDRLIGAGLAAATVAIPVLTVWPPDPFFLVYLLPSVTTAIALMAAVTRGMDWQLQRKGLMAALALCLIFFCLTRVVGVNGNMAPLLGWRWSGEAKIAVEENQVAAVAEEASPEDWPAFRGPRRDNRNMVDTFGIDWENDPPKELWRRPVGPGWSSFAVVGDYCFTQEQRGDLEAVVCYEVATGEQVWVNTIEARFSERMGDGPRATPTFHQGKLYTQGATGIFQCIDAATGETLWQRNIQEDGETKVPQWGFSSSPLVVGEVAIAYSGGGNGKSLIACNLETGEIVWTAGQGKNGYSSPHYGEVALTPQVIQISNYGIETFDPATGAPLWDQEWDIKNNPRVAQPYVMDLYQVIGGTGQGKGARLIKADKNLETGEWSAFTRWTSDRFRPYFNDYVYYHGFCYGYDGNRLACMDTTDGKVRWTTDRVGGQILLFYEMEMLLVLTEAGEVLLIPAFPSEGRVVARMPALTGKTWNHPVVTGGKLFVRNDTEAACYQLPPAPLTEEEAGSEAEAEAN